MDKKRTIRPVNVAPRGGEPRKGHETKATILGLRPMAGTVTLLLFALPAGAYFWLVHQYGVNTIFSDQWADMKVIQHLYSGSLNLGSLWVQHNEERNLFSNLLVVFLTYTTHFNVIVEMYVSAAIVTCAVGLLIAVHKRRSPKTWLVLLLPVALMLFSFVQFQNALWGFQVAWSIVLLTLVAALFFLDKPTLTGGALTGAIVVAVVGSFSLFQGLLIWPVGLVLLYHRRRARRPVVTWIVAGVVTMAVYFYGFDFSAPGTSNGSFGLHHPLLIVKFFFVEIGDVVGAEPSRANDALILGVLIFVVSIWLVIRCNLQRDERSPRPVGVALIIFGMLNALSTAVGRSFFGLSAAASSRFTTFDLLIPVGCYFIVLGREPSWLRPSLGEGRSTHTVGQTAGVVPAKIAIGRWKWLGAQKDIAFIRIVVVAFICLQVVMGFTQGLNGARVFHQEMLGEEIFVVGMSQASDPVVLGRADYAPQIVRKMTVIAQSHHLSLFSTSAAEKLAMSKPYDVPVADFYVDHAVKGVFGSPGPKYQLGMAFAANNLGCLHRTLGNLVNVDLQDLGSPGSLRVSPVQGQATVEVMFDSAAGNSAGPMSIDLVTMPKVDRWLNIPATRYRAFQLEVTSGAVLVCQSSKASPAASGT